jgi:hypothetical protein
VSGEGTAEVKGVWLTKDTARLGGALAVIVEMADGTMHEVISERCDDGPISHYAHARGFTGKPVRERGGDD